MRVRNEAFSALGHFASKIALLLLGMSNKQIESDMTVLRWGRNPGFGRRTDVNDLTCNQAFISRGWRTFVNDRQ